MTLHTVDSGGSGHALVFLHGFLESSTMWGYMSFDPLGVRRIFIDLPGHGKSDICEVLPPGMDVFAQLVMEALDRLDVMEYHIVGHSMGGYVAMELKRMDPRVDKVVLLNSNFWSDPEEKKIDRRRVAELVYRSKELFLREAIPNLFREPKANAQDIEVLIDESRRMEPDAIAYAALAMANRKDRSDLIMQRSADFMLIQGTDDKIVPKSLMENKLLHLKTNYAVIPNVGHMAHIEAPHEVVMLLNTFLAGKRKD
jgi:pimeloyl-ACP methyl ester carboxylesterase